MEEPLERASRLVGLRLERLLLTGEPLSPAEAGELAAAMQAAGEQWGAAPLGEAAARRYDTLAALDKVSIEKLGLARVAEALLWASGAPPSSGAAGARPPALAMPAGLAQAAQGALVWQARRALTQSYPAGADADTRARLLARSFPAACPALFAALPEAGAPPVDAVALRSKLPACKLGPSQVPPLGDARSLERELIRRVLVEADDALERLRSGPGGAGPWRAEAEALEQQLATGVIVPYEASATGVVEGVTIPTAAMADRLPPPRPAHIVPLQGDPYFALPPVMTLGQGIISIDDAPSPARRTETPVPPPDLTILDAGATASAIPMTFLYPTHLLVRTPTGLAALAYHPGAPDMLSRPLMIDVLIEATGRVKLVGLRGRATTVALADAPAALATALGGPDLGPSALVAVAAHPRTPISSLIPLLVAARGHRTYVSPYLR